LCKIFKISRQGYYKHLSREEKKVLNEEMIKELVCFKRRKQPLIGARKLYHILKKDITASDIRIGRDKFFDILRNSGLLIKRRKHRVMTTNSNHRFKIYDNLIKEMQVTRPDEVYVSDLTYIRTDEGFMYLALVTDLCSRKIVGFDLSDNLTIEGSIKALKMAVKDKTLNGSIHHSDRGIQYCSKTYTELLTNCGMEISMSEKGNPYENAVAERINGILKEEFMLCGTFKTKYIAAKAVKEAIETYNTLRPHMSIGYQTPNEKYAA